MGGVFSQKNVTLHTKVKHMNFVFISPHFPHTYWNFCQRLKQNGVTVLGIADAPYESLPHELKESLTELGRQGKSSR